MDTTTYIRSMKISRETVIGRKFGLLTILQVYKSVKHNGKYRCLTKCDCGNTGDYDFGNIKSGNTKSCGCLHGQNLNNQKYTTKYDYKECFFKCLTPVSLYILGLFYSDGNICKTENKATVNLHEGDKDLLEKISYIIKRSRKLVKISGNSFRDNQYRLCLYNKSIYNDLIDIGLHPNKSKTIIVDKRLEMSVDFWRGVVDGDGSIFSKDKLFTISLCSASISMIRSFKKFCYTIVKTKTNIHKHKNKDFYSFTLSGWRAWKLYNLLYENSRLFLERKKQYLKK